MLHSASCLDISPSDYYLFLSLAPFCACNASIAKKVVKAFVKESFCFDGQELVSVVMWYAIERERESEEKVNILTPLYLNQQALRKIR